MVPTRYEDCQNILLYTILIRNLYWSWILKGLILYQLTFTLSSMINKIVFFDGEISVGVWFSHHCFQSPPPWTNFQTRRHWPHSRHSQVFATRHTGAMIRHRRTYHLSRVIVETAHVSVPPFDRPSLNLTVESYLPWPFCGSSPRCVESASHF